MINRNKKIISLIIVSSMIFVNSPINTIYALASDISIADKNISTTNINSAALQQFTELFKKKNTVSIPTLKETDAVSFNSLLKVSFLIQKDSTNLISNEEYKAELLKNINSFDDLKSNFSISETDNTLDVYITIKNNYDIDTYINSSIEQTNSKFTENIFNVTYSKSNFDLNNSINMNYPNEGVNSILASDNTTSEYYNINNKIPSESNIASKMDLSIKSFIDTSKINLNNEAVINCFIRYNGNLYNIPNFNSNSSYILNNINVNANETIQMFFLTKDTSNTLKNYKISNTFSQSNDSIENLNYKVISSDNSIVNNDSLRYTLKLNNTNGNFAPNDNADYLPVFATKTNSQNTEKISVSTDLSSFEFNTTLNDLPSKIDYFYMDKNWNIHNDSFSNLIATTPTTLPDSEDLIIKLKSNMNLNGYWVSKINDMSSNIAISNNNIKLDWISPNYLIKNGLNTITITNGSFYHNVSFMAGVSNEKITKELSNNLKIDSNNEILINSGISEFKIKLTANYPINTNNIKCKLNSDSEIFYSLTQLSNTSVELNFNNIPTNKDFINSLEIQTLDSSNNTTTETYKLIRDKSAPMLDIINDNYKINPYTSTETNKEIYFKGNNNSKLSFKLSDASTSTQIIGVKNVNKNGIEIPLSINPNLNSLYYEYDNSTNMLSINNIANDDLTTFKITLKDKYDNQVTYTTNLYPDSKGPEITLLETSNDYRIIGNNIYIKDSISEDSILSLKLNLTDNNFPNNGCLDSTRFTVSTLSNNSLLNLESFNLDKNSTSYGTAKIKLVTNNSFSDQLILTAYDVFNNTSTNSSYKIHYYTSKVKPENINFEITGKDSVSNNNKITNIDTKTSNPTINISDKLNEDRIFIDFSKFKDFDLSQLESINYEYNNSYNTISYLNHENTKVPFTLVPGENIIKYTIYNLNGSSYTGSLSFNYDYKSPTIDFISSDGTIFNSTNEQNLDKSIKGLKINDRDIKEVTAITLNLTNTLTSKSIPLDLSKFTILNDGSLQCLFKDSLSENDLSSYLKNDALLDGKYSFSYKMDSSLSNSVNVSSSDFNSDKNNISLTDYSFTIDTETPEINLKEFTNNITTCKVFSDNPSITIGRDNSSDIIYSDNLPYDTNINCIITNISNNENKTFSFVNGTTINDDFINSEGRYSICLTATDSVGNSTSESLGYFIVDKSLPSISIDGINTDSNGYSRQPIKPTFNIVDTSIASVDVTITLNGNKIPTTPVGVTGDINKTYTLSDFISDSSHCKDGALITDGRYEITVKSTDRAGHKDTKTSTFTIDQTAPVISGITIGGKSASLNGMNYVTSHSSSILVNYSDNIESNENINLKITASLGTKTLNLSNGNSLTEDGEYTLTVQATDKAGNNSDLYTFKVVVDTVFPNITVNDVIDGYYYNHDITPSWKIDDTNAITSVLLNGTPFSSSTISAEGNYTLTIESKDEAGNISKISINFVIDKTAPNISVSGIENQGYYTSGVTPIIQWDDNDAIATVLLNNINFFGQEINEDGSYVLYVKVVDKAGNIKDLSLKFRLNVSTPEIFPMGFNDGDVLHGPFIPNFKFKDTVEYTILLNGKEYHGEELTDDGTYKFTVTAKDEDGVETVKVFSFKIENKSENPTEENKLQETIKNNSSLLMAVGSVGGLLLIGALVFIFSKRNK